ncbi:vascular endothelial growth factor A isoform X6 [Oxyura jamaicensis]|uniref:vascular endothelial growth factor A isoform X6 n=1 Tax=Oxyura jamaicensis TaxID=8884 RepID=UPI0015A59A4F|nr:vascular endothelial growth factor A isoform X6 [Oxyura jamaicensis]
MAGKGSPEGERQAWRCSGGGTRPTARPGPRSSAGQQEKVTRVVFLTRPSSAQCFLPRVAADPSGGLLPTPRAPSPARFSLPFPFPSPVLRSAPVGPRTGGTKGLCARPGVGGLGVVTDFLLSLQLSKAAPALGDGERKPNEVIKFLEVYERSFCRTIETLVDIFQEYPDEVEYIFKPSCVPLMRCAGCCGDEGLECVPVDVYNVTMEIMRIKPHQSQHIAHMSFLQHSKCDCRPKKDVKNKQEKKSKRGKGKGQKRKRKKGRYKPPSLCEKPRR